MLLSEWLQHPVLTRNGVHDWARAKVQNGVERGPPRLRGGKKKRDRLGRAERRLVGTDPEERYWCVDEWESKWGTDESFKP